MVKHKTGYEPKARQRSEALSALLVPSLSRDLIAVKSLNGKGYSVNFTPNGGEITKEGQRWNLTQEGGTWTFPEALSMAAQAATTPDAGPEECPLKTSWQELHERLGHVSERKLKSLEKTGLIKLTGECKIDECEACLLHKPRGSNISSVATHSGEVVVQMDGMPWKGGYGGQSGAIVFSHRANKMMHAYPYRHKSEAVAILDMHLVQQLPKLQPPATCIQTDAGTEFLSRRNIQVRQPELLPGE